MVYAAQYKLCYFGAKGHEHYAAACMYSLLHSLSRTLTEVGLNSGLATVNEYVCLLIDIIFWPPLRLGDLDPRRIQSIPQDVLRLHLFWP